MFRSRPASQLVAVVRGWVVAICSTIAIVQPSAGEESATPTVPIIDFERDVQPIFREHCWSCHGETTQESDYRLDVREIALQGGSHGEPPIVAGHSDTSPLVRFVDGSDPLMLMPPASSHQPRLTPQQVATVARWIDQNATWPDSANGRVVDKADWWSWRPLSPTPPPETPNTQTSGTQSSVTQTQSRNPIDAFIDAELIKRGLASSPQADRRTLIRRVYFDLIGLPPTFDETERFVADNDPQAWTRVVDTLLASPRYGERWARHWLDVVHYGETHGYDKDKPRDHAWPYRDYVVRAFNDDKPYDQFVQEQIAGDVFAPDSRDGVEARGFLSAGPWDFIGHAEVPESKIDGKIARHTDRDDMVQNTMLTFNSMTVGCAQCHDHKFDAISQADYYSLQAVFAAIDRTEVEYVHDATPRRAYIGAVHTGTGSFRGTGNEGGRPRTIHVLHRGDVNQPRDEAHPGALAAVNALPCRFELAPEHGEADRRAALALWLTDAQHPLTWRSIVNRVWQYHFGRGIVETSNDFGRNGSPPSHPELLDWLATEFRDQGGSLKHLHRLIVTSRTYQQASASRADCETIDADNVYLWRMNRTKLDAECVRDSVLVASGLMDLRMGGPSFRDFVIESPQHSPHYEYQLHDPHDHQIHRRSVYRFIVRSQLQPLMTALDCADPSMQVDRRNESLSPLQALAMLNNALMVAAAEHFANELRLTAEAEPADVALQHDVERAFRMALGRQPTDQERSTFTEYAERYGLANLCRLLFNLNEFAFVD